MSWCNPIHLKSLVRKACGDNYVLLSDEIYCQHFQEKQMDFLVWFWEGHKVVTHIKMDMP